MNMTTDTGHDRGDAGALGKAIRFGSDLVDRCSPWSWFRSRIERLRAPIDFEPDWSEHERDARSGGVELPGAHSPAGADLSVATHSTPTSLPRREVIATMLCNGRSIRVRPVQPADAEGVQEFVRHLSDTSRRRRFFAPIRELAPAMLARLTGSAGRRGPVLVAEVHEGESPRLVALAESAAGDDEGTCELALVVADAWQRLGLGRALMGLLIQAARDARYVRAVVDVLYGNDPMVALSRAHDFAFARSPHGASILRLVRELRSAPPSTTARGSCERTSRKRFNAAFATV